MTSSPLKPHTTHRMRRLAWDSSKILPTHIIPTPYLSTKAAKTPSPLPPTRPSPVWNKHFDCHSSLSLFLALANIFHSVSPCLSTKPALCVKAEQWRRFPECVPFRSNAVGRPNSVQTHGLTMRHASAVCVFPIRYSGVQDSLVRPSRAHFRFYSLSKSILALFLF